MNIIEKENKAILRDLIPFFASSFLYCILPVDNSSLWNVITKCAPIAALMHFVLFNGLPQSYQYSCRILVGLIFCVIGDAILVSDDYFIFGLIFFTFGHVSYILAFGFKPVKLMLYPVIGSMATMIGSTMVTQLTGVLLIGVPFYIFIISIMIWRAGARIQTGIWNWFHFIALVGSILFAISDTFLGINRFVFKIPYAQVIIMTFYYSAQLFIALSVLEYRVNKSLWEPEIVKDIEGEKEKEKEIQGSEGEKRETECERPEKESEKKKEAETTEKMQKEKKRN